MISSNPAPTLTRLLVPLSAAFLLYAGGVLASDRADDAQAQARALLAGKPTSRAGTIVEPYTVSESRNDLSAFDPQTQARQMLLGNSGVSRAPEKAAAWRVRATSPSGVPGQDGGRPPADVQEMARRVIQGGPFEPNISAHPLRALVDAPHPVTRRD